MYDAISLLEQLACTPYGADAVLLDRIDSLDPQVRLALNAGDAARLAVAVGGRATMACMVYAPDQDEPAREDGPRDDEPTPADAPEELHI